MHKSQEYEEEGNHKYIRKSNKKIVCNTVYKSSKQSGGVFGSETIKNINKNGCKIY